jgi:enterochelin esterase-like enzyme
MSAIHQLLDLPPGERNVDKWMAGKSFPIVEDRNATFVWRGKADAVRLRHFIFGLESANPLECVEGTDLWYVTMEIPARSRVEYKLEIHRGDHSRWIEDPLNPFRARDPFGANSVLQSAGYAHPTWVEPDPRARLGAFKQHHVPTKALGGTRFCQVYLPARFTESRRYSLVVMHDGSDYLNYASMKVVLDNLIDRLEIPDLIVACIDSPDRLKEYGADRRHAEFVTEELLPWLTARYPLRDAPRARCLMGASFGGVASLSTAFHYPGVWGRLLLQSGSFAFTDIGHHNHRGPVFDPVVRFMNEFRGRPSAVSERVFMSCGTYESLIYENRSMVPLLADTGMQVRLVEARDGHNWENWRNRSREGLSWLFPGPLMMVYE